jgi:aquaporin Z
MLAKLLAEGLGTFWLVLGGCGSAVLAGRFLDVGIVVILGTTHRRAPTGFAGLAIGLALTLIHLVSIPVTGTSVNPARSTGPAVFVGDWAVRQLWLFWIAPLAGGVLGGLAYRTLFEARPEPDIAGRAAGTP